MFQIRVPATIANVGPGFDSFGLAVNLYNTFTFKPSSANAIEGQLPPGLTKNPADNLVFEAMNFFFEKTGNKVCPATMSMDLNVPVTRGLGSSSTAIVAGMMAANFISGGPLSKEELLQLATTLEGHPDNVAPALLGGLQLCDQNDDQHVTTYTVPFPADWRVLVVIPQYPVSTEEARKALPENPSWCDAIYSLRKASLLMYALLTNNETAFSQSLDDRLHQPHRGKLIKEWDAIRNTAKECGAFGTVISGSGPTMAVFYPKTAQSDVMAGLDDIADATKLEIKRLSVDTTGAVPVV